MSIVAKRSPVSATAELLLFDVVIITIIIIIIIIITHPQRERTT